MLTISEREGSFPGMLKQRKFTVVYRQRGRQVSDFSLENAKGRTVTYKGKTVNIKL